jgi:hypothetical protein
MSARRFRQSAAALMEVIKMCIENDNNIIPADHEHEAHEHDHEHTHSHEHCGHSHTHTHADGTTHTHAHTHSHGAASSPEEALALLKYMLDHNRHHAEELHDLAHSFDDVAGDLIHDAVDKLGESNDLIEQALSLIINA